jgi:hypothetical protein
VLTYLFHKFYTCVHLTLLFRELLTVVPGFLNIINVLYKTVLSLNMALKCQFLL